MKTANRAILEAKAKRKQKEEQLNLLIGFVKDCATNWDCDSDAHKYGTTCRACGAQKLLSQIK